MSYLFKNGMGDEGSEIFQDVSEFLTNLQQTVTGTPGSAPPPADGGSIFGTSSSSSSSGGGVQGLIDFISTRGADLQFKVVSGVCKPMNEPTLRVVQDLQRQMNRVAQVKGFTKLQVDGDIGSNTVSLLKSVKAAAGGRVTTDTTSCSTVGPSAKVAAAEVKAFADSIGAPSSTSAPALTSQPSIVTPAGLVKPVAASAGLIDAVKGMPLPMKVAFGGIMAGIGYFVFFDKPRGKKRK